MYSNSDKPTYGSIGRLDISAWWVFASPIVTLLRMISVRPMTPEDIPLLATWMVTVPLWQRYNLTTEKARAQFEMAFAREDILLVADMDSERACGFAWCMKQGAFGRSVYLRLIGVRPDLASGGAGSTLLEAAEQEAVKISADLFLLVSDFNHDAQRFYERHGYRRIGEIAGYVLPDVNELIYRKSLR